MYQLLYPGFKHLVMLQCPTFFEEVKMHAKLKEYVPSPKPADGSDEILKALTQLQEKSALKRKSTITAANHYHPFSDQVLLVIRLQVNSTQ